MQAIMETLFDMIYLCTVITMGFMMLKKANGNKQYHLFGLMAILLGFGDAFHLIPRAYGLCTTGLEANAVALGIGKLITSITMTVFYVLLYYIWRIRYKVQKHTSLDYTIYALSALRIFLCLMPQNDWLNYNSPLSWGIYRNIPFALLGLLIIILYFKESKKAKDRNFGLMWFAIVLSFGFYIPVVLFASAVPLIGMLMIPKTLAYVWIVWMGFSEMKSL